MNTNWKDYEILATGDGMKLERWGEVYLLRPDPQAIWQAPFQLDKFDKLNALYHRSSNGGGGWKVLKKFPNEWTINYDDVKFLIKPMGFKHTGLFPEQGYNWQKMAAVQKASGRRLKVLNLFGYTGGASVYLAKAGAIVTHVDAAKNMVDRCKQNSIISKCPQDGIRYIVDDCMKFVQREIKRGNTYDGVVMDPPSYGRGTDGQVWKMETSICQLVAEVKKLLPDPEFFLINSYTTGLQPTVIENILKVYLGSLKGNIEAYELCLPTGDRNIKLPCGCTGIFIKG